MSNGKENMDFWDELTSLQKEEINKADLEIANKQTTDYKTFMTKHRNYSL